jgi:NAD(P)-dependent dehydrogenase (short-subunit alcohol dehydrogenase family)
MLLSGRTALVTGGGSGIGRATASAFAAEGATVVVADRDRAAAAQVAAELVTHAPETRHRAVHMEITDPDSVRQAFDVVRDVGPLKAAFLGAGIWDADDASILRLDDAAWHRTIEVNLTGTYYTARSTIEAMQEQGGAIVTVASVAAVSGWKSINAYVASKGGIISLTRALAADWSHRGIRVNCLCPGAVRTPMSEAALERSRPSNLMGREGAPSEIASVATFLVSDWSSFMTGATVVADGGTRSF